MGAIRVAQMLWVEVRKSGRDYWRYSNRRLTGSPAAMGSQEVRVLDCIDCHNRGILAFESPEPFQYLLPVAEKDPDRRVHEYLQTEFLRSRR